jgi:hypothetical protein
LAGTWRRDERDRGGQRICSEIANVSVVGR